MRTYPSDALPSAVFPAARSTAWAPSSLAAAHIWLIAAAALLGVLAALLMRFELLTPGLDTMQARTFGSLLTLHGALLMYFVALPAFPGVVVPWILARLRGDSEPVLPRLGLVAVVLQGVGLMAVLAGFAAGGSEAGAGLDSGFGGRFDQPGVVPVAIGGLFAALSLVPLGVQAVAAALPRRVHGAEASTAVLAITTAAGGALSLVAGAVLAVCMSAVLADVAVGLPLFAASQGGDPTLYLAWMSGFRAAATGMLLVFATGVCFAVLADRVRSPRVGFALPVAIVALAASALVSALGARAPGAWIAWIAFSVVLIDALRLLRRGLSAFDAPMAFALGFFVLAMQALTLGLILAKPFGLNLLSDTTFAAAQFHLLVVAILGLGFVAGLLAAWPSLFRRFGAQGLGKSAAAIIWCGAQLTFVPGLVLGFRGASFRANAYPADFQVLNVLSTAGATVLIAGLTLAVLALVFARKERLST